MPCSAELRNLIEGFLEKNPNYRLTTTHAINSPYFHDTRKNKTVFKIPPTLKAKESPEEPAKNNQNEFLDVSADKMVCFLNHNLQETYQQNDIEQRLQDAKSDRKKCWNLYTTEKIKSGKLEEQIKHLTIEKSQAIKFQNELEKQLENTTIRNEEIKEELKMEREKGETFQIEITNRKNEEAVYNDKIINLQNQLEQLTNKLKATVVDKNNFEQLLLSEHNKIAAIEHQLSQEKLEKEKFHNILQELNNISPANDNPKSKVLENLVMQLEITPDDCTQSQTTAAILIETTNQLAATTIAEPSSYIVKYEPGVKLNFNCGICQKDFNQRSDLQRHINEIHGSTENFQCNICSKKFKVLRYLKDHQDQVHYKKKIYKCSICNKKFTTKSLRDLHRRKCNNK